MPSPTPKLRAREEGRIDARHRQRRQPAANGPTVFTPKSVKLRRETAAPARVMPTSAAGSDGKRRGAIATTRKVPAATAKVAAVNRQAARRSRPSGAKHHSPKPESQRSCQPALGLWTAPRHSENQPRWAVTRNLPARRPSEENLRRYTSVRSAMPASPKEMRRPPRCLLRVE